MIKAKNPIKQSFESKRFDYAVLSPKHFVKLLPNKSGMTLINKPTKNIPRSSGKLVRNLIILFAAFLLGFILLKGFTASFTHDESNTFNRFVQQESVWEILTYHKPIANNHLLNTLLMKGFSKVFGAHDLILRMPNILAFISYIVFSFMLVNLANSRLVLPIWILMVANPYLLDFFALARGYGLAIAFMTGSVFFFSKHINLKKEKDLAWAIFLGCLAMLSNFTLIYYLVSLIIIANIYWVAYPNQKSFIKYNKVSIGALIPILYVLLVPIRKMVENNQLYLGGNEGFWSNTVISLIESIRYEKSYFLPTIQIAEWFVIVVTAGAIITLITLFIKRTPFTKSFEYLAFGTLALIFIAFIATVAHYLLDTKFFISRTALFLYPLFIFTIACLGSIWVKVKKVRPFTLILLYAFAGLMTLHTFKSQTTKVYLDWRYDANTETMLKLLDQRLSGEPRKRQIDMGISWRFQPTINYYRNTKNYQWLKKVKKDGFNRNNDFFYVQKKDLSRLEGKSTRSIHEFPLSNSILFKNTNPN